MLRVHQPDGQPGEVPEHDQDVRDGRGRVHDAHPLGQPTVLLAGRTQAVLRVEGVRHAGGVRANAQQVHAVLHAHLVRGLDVLGVLPRRPLQLLCDREWGRAPMCVSVAVLIIMFIHFVERLQSNVGRLAVGRICDRNADDSWSRVETSHGRITSPLCQSEIERDREFNAQMFKRSLCP